MMTPINPLPVKVAATSPFAAQISAAVRVFVVVVGLVVALLGFVRARDLAGLVDYVQSNEFLTGAGVIAAAVAFVWGQVRTHVKQRQLVTIAQRAPDDVAQLVGKGDGGNAPPAALPANNAP